VSSVGLPALRLGQQGADLQAGGLAGLQVPQEIGQGQAGIDDVLDHEHVATLDVDVEVLEDPYDPGRVGRGAVGGDRHEVDLTWD